MSWKKWLLLGGAAAALAAAPTYTALILSGSSSGLVTIKPPASFTSYSLNLPTTPGTAGQTLTSQGGSAPMTWAASGLVVGTTGITSGTNGRLLYDHAGVLGEEASTALTINPSQITQGGATINQVLTWTGSVWGPAAGGGGLTIGTTPISGGTNGYVLEDVSGVLQNIGTKTADLLPAAATPSGTDTVLAHQTGTNTVGMKLSDLASFILSGFSGGISLTDGTTTLSSGTMTLTGGKISGTTFYNNGRNGTTIGRSALSSFAWINQGSSAVTDESPGPLIISFAANGATDNMHILSQPALTAPWTVTGEISTYQQNHNYVMNGICLYDSVSGQLIVFNIALNSVSVTRWSSLTSYASILFTYSITVPAPTIFLRIYHDGTSLHFLSSPTGSIADWTEWGAESATAFLGTITDVGLHADPNNQSGAADVPLKVAVWGFENVAGTGTNTTWP